MKSGTVIERRLADRRSGADRRNLERRVEAATGGMFTVPLSGARERRRTLRRRDFRRSLFNRRAAGE